MTKTEGRQIWLSITLTVQYQPQLMSVKEEGRSKK